MRTTVALMMSIALLSGLFAQDAKTLLKQVQQKYRQMKSMEVSVEIRAEFSQGGSSSMLQVQSTLALQKPNRVAMKTSSNNPMLSREIYSDGKNLFIYIPAAKQYIKRESPPDLQGQGGNLLGEAGMLLSFAEANLDDPNSKARYTFKGKKTLNGKPTRIVEVRENQPHASRVYRLYVGEQDKLVYRVELDETMQMSSNQQGQPPRQFTMKTEANIRYISFNKPIPASRFKFTPPKDAKPMQMPQQKAPVAPPPGR